MTFDEIAKEFAALKVDLETARNERDEALLQRDREREAKERLLVARKWQEYAERDEARAKCAELRDALDKAESTITRLEYAMSTPVIVCVPPRGTPSTIRDWQRASHALAVEKGWHPEDGPDPRDPNRALAWLMLASSELAEAAEEVREGRWEQWTEESGKPAGVGVEVADCVIRLLDSCEAWGIDLQARIEDKHAFNRTRPHRHGGKAV
jgi:NTP pyrophosphatase (non-canonical NTP hydrolase)